MKPIKTLFVLSLSFISFFSMLVYSMDQSLSPRTEEISQSKLKNYSDLTFQPGKKESFAVIRETSTINPVLQQITNLIINANKWIQWQDRNSLKSVKALFDIQSALMAENAKLIHKFANIYNVLDPFLQSNTKMSLDIINTFKENIYKNYFEQNKQDICLEINRILSSMNSENLRQYYGKDLATLLNIMKGPQASYDPILIDRILNLLNQPVEDKFIELAVSLKKLCGQDIEEIIKFISQQKLNSYNKILLLKNIIPNEPIKPMERKRHSYDVREYEKNMKKWLREKQIIEQRIKREEEKQNRLKNPIVEMMKKEYALESKIKELATKEDPNKEVYQTQLKKIKTKRLNLEIKKIIEEYELKNTKSELPKEKRKKGLEIYYSKLTQLQKINPTKKIQDVIDEVNNRLIALGINKEDIAKIESPTLSADLLGDLSKSSFGDPVIESEQQPIPQPVNPEESSKTSEKVETMPYGISEELMRELSEGFIEPKNILRLPPRKKKSAVWLAKEKYPPLANEYFIETHRLLNEYQRFANEEILKRAIQIWQDKSVTSKTIFPEREEVVDAGYIWSSKKIVPLDISSIINKYKYANGRVNVKAIKAAINRTYFQSNPQDACKSIPFFLEAIHDQGDFAKEDVLMILKYLKEGVARTLNTKNFPLVELILDNSFQWSEKEIRACLILLNKTCNFYPEKSELFKSKESELNEIEQDLRHVIESKKKSGFIIDKNKINELVQKLNDIYNNSTKSFEEEPAIEESKDKPVEVYKPAEKAQPIELPKNLVEKKSQQVFESPAEKQSPEPKHISKVSPEEPELSSLKDTPLINNERKLTSLTGTLEGTSVVSTATIEEKKQPELEQPQISPEDAEAKELLDKWIGISKSGKQSELVFNQLTEEIRKIQRYLERSKIDQTQDIQDALHAIKTEYIQKTLPNQIETFIIKPIQKGAIKIEKVSLKELDAYEKQISIYLVSGGVNQIERKEVKKTLELVNSKRRELMAESLLNKTAPVKEKREEIRFQAELILALKNSDYNLYSSFDKNKFSNNTKNFIVEIILLGENIEKIKEENDNFNEYLKDMSPYVLALATHPFLDTDEMSQDNSLMFADKGLFDFVTYKRQISFSLFEEACKTIAENISGFPTVPARRKASVNATAKLPVSPTSIIPQPPAAQIPTPQPYADDILRLMKEQRIDDSELPLIVNSTDPSVSGVIDKNISNESHSQPAGTPKQPTGLTGLISNILSGIWNFVSSLWNGFRGLFF